MSNQLAERLDLAAEAGINVGRAGFKNPRKKVWRWHPGDVGMFEGDLLEAAHLCLDALAVEWLGTKGWTCERDGEGWVCGVREFGPGGMDEGHAFDYGKGPTLREALTAALIAGFTLAVEELESKATP